MSKNIFENTKLALKGGDYTVVNKDASVKTIIESYNPFFANFFNNREKAEQAMTIALDVAMDAKFDNCNKHSIVKAIIDTYRLGLNPTPGIDHTYLVPYSGNIKLMISHKGFTSLLFKAGWLVEPFPVYKCDEFSHSINENGQQIKLIQNWDKRVIGNKKWVHENLTAVYIIAKHITGLTKTLVVYKSEIEKLRLVSPSQTYANPKTSTPEKIQKVKLKLPVDIWEDWYEEMALAKSIKKIAKQLPLGDDQISSMIKFAINIDDYSDINDEEKYQKTLKNIENLQNKNKDTISITENTETKITAVKNGLRHLMIKVLNEGNNGNKYFVSIPRIGTNNKKYKEFLQMVENLSLGYKTREKDIVIIFDIEK